MGSHHEHEHEHGHDHGKGFRISPVQLASMALAAAAVAKELRTPPEERTWHGKVAGFVPYEFRFPTLARIKERMWDPHAEHLVGPQVFGVGWTVNLGRLVEIIKQKVRSAD